MDKLLNQVNKFSEKKSYNSENHTTISPQTKVIFIAEILPLEKKRNELQLPEKLFWNMRNESFVYEDNEYQQ